MLIGSSRVGMAAGEYPEGTLFAFDRDSDLLYVSINDGVSWISKPISLSGVGCEEGAYNGASTFCLSQSDSSNKNVTFSDDSGVLWSENEVHTSNFNAQDIIWNGSIFLLLLGGKSSLCYTSPDGITWTQRSCINDYWWSVAWNGSVFCATAYNAVTRFMTSPDGITWTARTVSVQTYQGIAWNGSVFCVVVQNRAYCYTSPDGITWTQRTMPASGQWRRVEWNGTVFLAVQRNGTVAATSPDGITWTQRTLPANNSVDGVNLVWNGTVFCIVNSTGQTMTSPDGITWELSSNILTGKEYALTTKYLTFGTY